MRIKLQIISKVIIYKLNTTNIPPLTALKADFLFSYKCIYRVCRSTATKAPCLMSVMPSERSISSVSPLLVYFGVLPRRATLHGPPHTSTHSPCSQTEIKRGIVQRRGKSHLINLPGTFLSLWLSVLPASLLLSGGESDRYSNGRFKL